MRRYTKPNLIIFQIKVDLEAAYRRLQVTTAMALLIITIIGRISYILLHLPFGVANGPSDYSIISKVIMDQTNDILEDDTFNSSNIHFPLYSTLALTHILYPDCTPFGIARELFIIVPFRHAAADEYIDDIITAMLDERGRVLKGSNAALLAVHIFFAQQHILILSLDLTPLVSVN